MTYLDYALVPAIQVCLTGYLCLSPVAVSDQRRFLHHRSSLFWECPVDDLDHLPYYIETVGKMAAAWVVQWVHGQEVPEDFPKMDVPKLVQKGLGLFLSHCRTTGRQLHR